MTDWIVSFGAHALQTFWLPLLGWTVATGALLLLLQVWRRLHPAVHYQARTVLLLALPLGLLGAGVLDGRVSLLPEEVAALVSGPAVDGTYVVQMTGEEGEAHFIAEPVAGAGWHATAYWGVFWGMLSIFFLIGAMGGLWRLVQDARALKRLHANRTSLDVATVRAALAHAPAPPILDDLRVQYARVEEGVPLTYGWHRPVILLPQAVLAHPEQLAAVLLHEGVHIARRDYVLGWVEAVIGALFRLHPLVGLLRRQVSRLREVTCDGRVVATGRIDAQQYAAVLVALATGRSAPVLSHSIITASTTLRARLLALYEQRRASMVSLLLVTGLVFSTVFVVTLGSRVAPEDALPEMLRLQVVTASGTPATGALVLMQPTEAEGPKKFELLGVRLNGTPLFDGGGALTDIQEGFASIKIGSGRRMILAGQRFEGATPTALLQSPRLMLVRFDGENFKLESRAPIMEHTGERLWVRVVQDRYPENTFRFSVRSHGIEEEW